MAYNRIQAARLLSSSEMTLFAASLADQLVLLTASQLRSQVRRARTLRDKFQDLLRRQRVDTRARTGTKGGTSGTANQRTAEKAQAFTEALQRFEKRLAKVEAAAARATTRTATERARLVLDTKRANDAAKAAARLQTISRKGPATGPKPAGKRLGPTSESARTARHASQFKDAGSKAVLGHVSSLGRHNQAKRDQRG
ncbi:MAG: hypothetical protein Q8K38_06990 [Burkholderiaceae bacterium]|nr:hypothetical protein [Burkholderiaceae bacterium]MDZ4144135.1 hypothetical protein [Burkholderiales bacterium]